MFFTISVQLYSQDVLLSLPINSESTTYIKLKAVYLSICLSVCLPVCLSVFIFGVLITQQSVHLLKQYLLEMKVVSLKNTKFFYKPTELTVH